MEQKIHSISRKNHPDFPTWFDIKNYDVLSQLSANEFLAQLEHRICIYAQQQCMPVKRETVKLHGWEDIKQGRIIIFRPNRVASTLESHLSFIINQEQTPLLPYLKDSYNQKLQQQHQANIEALSEKDPFKLECARRHENSLFREQQRYLIPLIPTLQSKAILTQLNLEDYTDADLLKKIAAQLPYLRKLLDIPEPTKPTHKSGKQTLKKYLSYQVIAYLDLSIHFAFASFKHTKKLQASASLLSHILFAGQYDEEQVKRTVRPFIEDIIQNHQAIEYLVTNIEQDKELQHKKMFQL
ncbi:DUF6387 family protein [Photobacterium damselae]|uniref:DUF6387 family protein n=1 Tax=Photobacterium damselae TaxID=38293 RepID=UPI00406800D2